MNDLLSTNFILPLLVGIGLVAATGFRVFLPLFILSLLLKLGFLDLTLNENWSWIVSQSAVITFGILSFIEIVIYYIPYLDNFLDKLSVPLSALAGIFILKIILPEMNEYLAWCLAVVVGGGISLFISGTMTAARNVATITTRGEGNFVISTLETLCCIILILMSIYLPVLSFIFVLFIIYSCYYAYIHVTKRESNVVVH